MSDSEPDLTTAGSALHTLARSLNDAGIPDSRIEARIMVTEATGLSAADLLIDPHRTLNGDATDTLDNWLQRRLKHEPLPYITGWQEFYGRRFNVDSRVLIPRSETESLVEQALAFIAERNIAAPVIADIGTGSGALAVTLACELPKAKIIAIDLSKDALDVARANAELNHVTDRIEFRHGDLLDPLTERCDVIVSNPPYVLSGYLDSSESQAELKFEPRSALDGGEDGMTILRRLIKALPAALKASDSATYIEMDPPVTSECLSAAQIAFPLANVAILSDLAGLERFVAIELNGR